MKIYKEDIGTVIYIDMGTDISLAENCNLFVRKGDGVTTAEWTPEIYNTNYLKYTIVENDLSISGEYKVTPYLEIGSWEGYGETVSFTVYGLYE